MIRVVLAKSPITLLLILFVSGLLVDSGVQNFAADNSALNSAMATIKTDQLKRHVDSLADDVLEGREAGTRGAHAAGTMLRKQIEEWGLKPGAAQGEYFQTFGADYRNLLVILEGSDPKLKDEYLVVGAHYDHVGYGNGGNSFGPVGFIHNGADDNASGVAALMEVIEAFTQLGAPPKRSILFAFWDGEEKGLLGSRHWVNNPTIPLKQVRLSINTDMVGRLRKNRLEIGGSRTAVGLRRLVSQANTSDSIWLDFSWKRQANSDHWPFFERDIPYVLFHTGLHDDYHRPSDDIHLINQEGLTNVTKILFSVTYALANADSISKFRSAVHNESTYQRQQLEAPLASLPPRLGVQWVTEPAGATSSSSPATKSTDAATNQNEKANAEKSDKEKTSTEVPESVNNTPDSSKEESSKPTGVVISSVRFGTPASIGALRSGDRIIEFAGLKIEDGEHLRRVVSAATGETKAVVKRPGSEEPITLNVKLPENKIRIGISWREDPVEPGTVIITRVLPGSPAAAAGVKARDRIYQVAGEDFKNARELHERLNSVSSPVKLLLERQGRMRTLELTLDEIKLPPAVEPSTKG